VKPVALVADALRDCSGRGEIVLDGFLGSGTTLISAERTGRICRGLELDPLYIDIAIRRWQMTTNKKAQHAGSGRLFDELSEDGGPVDCVEKLGDCARRSAARARRRRGTPACSPPSQPTR
jgi:hypothetical protein